MEYSTEDPQQVYDSIIHITDLADFSIEYAIQHIGTLIDTSLDLNKKEGLYCSIRLSFKLMGRELNDEQLCNLYYFLGNAWANLRQLSRIDHGHDWNWEKGEMEYEIIYFRKAVKSDAFSKLSKKRQCEILTNLGNIMDEIGRFVEAIEYFNNALKIIPSFAMARGNLGIGFYSYAGVLYDEGHRIVFFKHARSELQNALDLDIAGQPRDVFDHYKHEIESILPSKILEEEIEMDDFSLGEDEKETKYRKWCLNNRLFLNPLNDLGPYPIAARDVLTLPSITVGIDEGPYYPGFFNQLKQEFVSARYLYYEGINSDCLHFSDKDVLLFNTFDYPSYSLASEKVKMAFKVAYSLFDKIAYFLNNYLNLSIPENKVYFKRFWYKSGEKNKGLRREFQHRENWPLRGLFWLSKDLFENKPGFENAIQPDAQKISEIRNHLEHKYFKLHDEFCDPSFLKLCGLDDTLSYSIYRPDFYDKTLRILKMVRSALIYLPLAVYCEELIRSKERGKDSKIFAAKLDLFDDEWKI